MMITTNELLEIVRIILITIGIMVAAFTLLLIILSLSPKNANNGTWLAFFGGPLVYIYVNKWAKALGLFFLVFFTGGIGILFLWPYAMVNIRTDVNDYLEERGLLTHEPVEEIGLDLAEYDYMAEEEATFDDEAEKIPVLQEPVRTGETSVETPEDTATPPEHNGENLHPEYMGASRIGLQPDISPIHEPIADTPGDTPLPEAYESSTYSMVELEIRVTGEGTTTPQAGIHRIKKDVDLFISAIPSAGWNFVGWIGQVDNSYEESTSIKMDSDKSITALFRASADNTLAST